MRIAVTARAPEGVDGQTMTVSMNEAVMTQTALPGRWQETRFVVPEDVLLYGENELCLGFSTALEPNRRDSCGRSSSFPVRSVRTSTRHATAHQKGR